MVNVSEKETDASETGYHYCYRYLSGQKREKNRDKEKRHIQVTYICRLLIISFVICFLLGIVGMGVATAKTIYVSADGSGSYNCDGTDDHLEINKAIYSASDGDVVHLKAGTYIINDTIMIKSNIIFEGDGQNTIIKVKNTNNRGDWKHIFGNSVTNTKLQFFTLDGNKGNQFGVDVNDYIQGIEFLESSDIIIQNITVRNVITDCFRIVISKDCIIRNCVAELSNHDGFYVGVGDNVLVENCIANNLGAHGIRFYNTKNSIARGNKLYAGDFGIEINTQGGGCYGGNIYEDNIIDQRKYGDYDAISIEADGTTTISNETFENNIIAGSYASGFSIFTMDSARIGNILIKNNVINDCANGIERRSGDVEARNNIITNCVYYGILGKVRSTYNDVWNNTDGNYGGEARAGIGDLSLDPQFVNLANYDFHLNSTSPCIDAGDPNDPVLEPSPNGGRINIGAYGNTEEASKIDKTPPATVKDLLIGKLSSKSVTLTWSAPGDDGYMGNASQYDIRYSTSLITDTSWDSATQCEGEPNPQSASCAETFTVFGLSPNTTYYFALKAADEVPNWAGISNCASATTLEEPYIYIWLETEDADSSETSASNRGDNSFFVQMDTFIKRIAKRLLKMGL